MEMSTSTKDQIVETAQKLVQKGYLMNVNLSLRIPGQDAFAITPSFAVLAAFRQLGEVCILDFKLNPLQAVC